MAEALVLGAEGFSLPLTAITLTQAILAKKGSGKTYTATVIAEEMLKRGVQVVIADPTGAWWGLKSSADGDAQGFPVVVFGGEHADVPLEADAGEVVALSLIEGRYSAVIDLSLFRKGELNRFMAAFLETLYRKNRQSMHLIVDEADTVAPQKPYGDEARTLGAMQDVVRRGRIRGIGVTMITQRPQVLNKDVLTQADVLVALRLSHPKDLAAIKEWVDVHAEAAVAKEMLTSLPSLPIGTAWFWAPALNILQRVAVRKRETFDSSRTPQPGEVLSVPKVLAQVDIKRLGEQIAATVEQAKANSPAALKAEIARLKSELDAKGDGQMGMSEDIAAMERELEELRPLRDEMDASRLRVNDCVSQVIGVLQGLLSEASSETVAYTSQPALPSSASLRAPVQAVQARTEVSGMSKAERAILTVLAQRGHSAKSTVAAWAGYSVGGGGFNNALCSCRTKGWLEGSDPLAITQSGRVALGAVRPLPSGDALLAMWTAKLGKAERTILETLARRGRMAKAKLAELCDYTASGGGFNNALSALRTLELIAGTAELDLVPDFAQAIRGRR